MQPWQFATILASIFGSVFAGALTIILFLISRIDGLGSRTNNLGDRLSDKIDHLSERTENQITTLLNTIHGVHDRVTKLEVEGGKNN
jgi:hypothetical protein